MKNSLFLLSASKSLALLMFCGAMSFSCDAQIRKPKTPPPSTGIAAEANRMAAEWKTNTFRQCTDDSGKAFYYTKQDVVATQIKKTGAPSSSPNRSPIILYEINDMSFRPMHVDEIPELEKLSGLEWRGWIEIQRKYIRIFSTESGAWSEWGNYAIRPTKFIGSSPYLQITLALLHK